MEARPRRTARRAAVGALGVGLCALLTPFAGCDCGGPLADVDATVDADTGLDAPPPPVDAALADAPAPPQPCASGIHRSAVALPAIENEEDGQALSRADVVGDVVLVARTDVYEPDLMPTRATRELFARVDPHDGHVIASGFADLPFPPGNRGMPRGFRVLADGSTEVLVADTSDSTAALIARFGADGRPIEVRPVSPAMGQSLNPIFGSVATRDGFILLVRDIDAGGTYDGVALADIRGDTTSVMRIAGELGPLDPGMSSIDSADGTTVWLVLGHVTAMGATTGVDVFHFDATAPTFSLSPTTLGGFDGMLGWLGIAGTADGSAVLAVGTYGGVDTHELRWLDRDANIAGMWRGTDSAFLVGVAGTFPQQAVAEITSGSSPNVLFGVASAPGALVGTGRPIVAGVSTPEDSPTGGPIDGFGQLSDGAFTIAVWSGSLTVITLCGAAP